MRVNNSQSNDTGNPRTDRVITNSAKILKNVRGMFLEPFVPKNVLTRFFTSNFYFYFLNGQQFLSDPKNQSDTEPHFRADLAYLRS